MAELQLHMCKASAPGYYCRIILVSVPGLLLPINDGIMYASLHGRMHSNQGHVTCHWPPFTIWLPHSQCHPSCNQQLAYMVARQQQTRVNAVLYVLIAQNCYSVAHIICFSGERRILSEFWNKMGVLLNVILHELWGITSSKPSCACELESNGHAQAENMTGTRDYKHCTLGRSTEAS